MASQCYKRGEKRPLENLFHIFQFFVLYSYAKGGRGKAQSRDETKQTKKCAVLLMSRSSFPITTGQVKNMMGVSCQCGVCANQFKSAQRISRQMAVSASATSPPCTSLVSLTPKPTGLSTPTLPSLLFLVPCLLLLSPPLLPTGRTLKKITSMFNIPRVCFFFFHIWYIYIFLYDCQHSDVTIIKYLLGVDEQRCGVLVNKLIASIGVDMSHLCAVDVKWHLVLRDFCASRVHGWSLIQSFSGMNGRLKN